MVSLAALGAPGCSGQAATPTAEEAARAELETAGPAAVTYNNDPDFLIVYNENVAQFGNETDGTTPATEVAGVHWKNIVKCIQDPACNGFGVVPDMFIFQEISRDECESFDNYLEAQIAGGANTWDWFSQENHRDTSNHWMSSCTLFRRARLVNKGTAALVQVTGNGGACTDEGTRIGSVSMQDTERVAAGLATTWVTVGNFHEDHFGATPQDICDNATFSADGVHVASWDPTTSFCVYQNARTMSAQLRGATLQIMAGDFNYQAKHCSASGTPAGRPNDYFRCHYKAITDGFGDCAGATFTWPNLGWTDIVGKLLPPAYADNSVDIDYVFTRYSAGQALMPATARNYIPGRVAKGFYTPATDAYFPSADQNTESISDHDGLLVKIRY